MAARKNEKLVLEKDLVQDTVEEKNDMEQSPEEKADADGEQTETSDAVPKSSYVITCRNKVTNVIGGVKFDNGVGRTDDAFAASWFAAKDGYTVEVAE